MTSTRGAAVRRGSRGVCSLSDEGKLSRAPLLHFKRHAISHAEFETLNQLVLCLCCATMSTLVFLLKSQHSPVWARIDREVE